MTNYFINISTLEQLQKVECDFLKVGYADFTMDVIELP